MPKAVPIGTKVITKNRACAILPVMTRRPINAKTATRGITALLFIAIDTAKHKLPTIRAGMKKIGKKNVTSIHVMVKTGNSHF